MIHLKVDSLPDPSNRFDLGEEIATGSWAKVYKAVDKEANGKTVAVKIQSYENDKRHIIDDEYRILRDFSEHPNFLDFYGVYRKRVSGGTDEIWFILQYCDGGSAIDFVKRLQSVNRRLSEEHIAYILKEAAKGLVELHKHHFVHRDVRGNNILLTSDGEVKLCDFGLTKSTGNTFGKRSTCIGSPCWMAPEMFVTSSKKNEELYGSRIDVWALGITAIELGDGAAPFLDMHPTRAMFQIIRNPPPTLYRPANWSQNYNDFIAECLEKNPDNRPFMVELLEHPFFTELFGPTGSDHHLSCEIKHLLSQIDVVDKIPKEEISILDGCIKRYHGAPEQMVVEDLCALDKLSEEKISDLLKQRLERGDSYTFVGDVLVSLNSNELPNEFPRSVHKKYNCKSRSDNAPHIFTVADSAFQDMLHHEEPQHILFAGESYSGKTTQMRNAVKHLCYLGEGNSNCSERVLKSLKVIHALVNAGTPVNPDSTRCALQSQLTFGTSGKLSGAIYSVFLLEKLRVSSTDMDQSNFHIFYYFYDAMIKLNELDSLKLETGRNYRYLRVESEKLDCKLPYCRNDEDGNLTKFQEFEENLKLLDFEPEQIQSIRKILAAVLILGNVRFADDGKFATIETNDEVQKIAQLLELDEKKFEWSLVNYCLVQSGVAEKRKHTNDEARDARDVLAGTIYSRLVDWIVNIINQKFAFGRAIFGDSNMISLNDMFGFECLPRNRIEQLMINSLNEQLQYHYNQRMFAWEMIELEEEQIPHSAYKYHNNKPAVDHLMTKPYGLFFFLDDATRDRSNYEFITDSISKKKNAYVQRATGHEFSVAHYTGKVTYDVREMADKNRDFLPPEMVETMRTSKNEIVKILFLNPLSKTGNLTVAYNHQMPSKKNATQKSKWGAALVAEKQRAKKLNTLSHGQYSQVHKMRTLSGVFRMTSLEILKGLSIGGNSGNTHFVRCIRPSLEYKAKAFHNDMVYQQIRALAIHDTAVARQKGYPQRVCFQEFLRRYKFLAFDFDENVELTKDNSRLLLIRLKMEGWAIGKTKVFLKYYNVEYLSRLYETQVKKIVKVQSMMRTFLAKRSLASKLKSFHKETTQKGDKFGHQLSEAEAALAIQKAYRGYKVRQKYGPLLNAKTGKIDLETSKFIRPFAKRWKVKSLFQILLLYRSARYQDLVNLTQQIHLYNQGAVGKFRQFNECMELDKIDPRETNAALLGSIRQPVRKLPFRLNDIPFYDTNYMCDPMTGAALETGDDSDQEEWDAPLRRTPNISTHIIDSSHSSSDYNANKYQRIIPGDEVSRHFSEPTRPVVYKRRPSSPSPNAPILRNEPSERAAISEDLSAIRGKLNPVKELQLLGRQNSTNDETEDAPPFNFQGMLRKTQHHRASMKRNKSDNEECTSPANGNLVYHNDNSSTPKVNFDFDENDNLPPPIAPRQKPQAPVPSQRKLSFGENTFIGEDDSLHSIGTYVQEEIHPGVMLEGYAVEL